MNMMKRQKVLVAAIGTSPAVLTETVWAMAHDKRQGLPDRISVVTTSRGKKQIEDSLLDGKPSVWDQMIASIRKDGVVIQTDFHFGRADIVVIPDEKGNDADDLRSAGDNLRAADTMLETIRKYTENPETVVYVSIAGGRKTMSALMLSCMSLLGRADDRVSHVLTTPDMLHATNVKTRGLFYFPERGATYEYNLQGRQERIAAGKVSIELFDVPFVRIRGWFQEKFKSLPPSYGALVAAVQEVAPPAERPAPFIKFDVRSGSVTIDGIDCALNGTDRAVLLLNMKSVYTRDAQVEVLSRLSALRPKGKGRDGSLPTWLGDFWASPRSGYSGAIDVGDLPKLSNQLREKLLKRLSKEYVEMLCPKYYRMGSYPKDRLELVRDESLRQCFVRDGM